MRQFAVCLLLLGAAAPLLPGGEQVVLRNGFRLAAQRHEITPAGVVKLYTATGEIELAGDRVAAYEPEEAAAALPATPTPAAAAPAVSLPSTSDPKKLLDAAAERYGVPAAFLHSVARAESAYRVDAVSPKGAIGVMQLMPATAAELGANPHDPAQNIDAGARHLRDLLEQYQGSAHKALSAYNAGAAAVQRFGGVPPYSETVNYVYKVLNTYHALSANKAQ